MLTRIEQRTDIEIKLLIRGSMEIYAIVIKSYSFI